MEAIDIRRQVVIACRALGIEGVTRGPVGHVSARVPGTEDEFFIKARGVEEEGLEFVTDLDIIRINSDGAVIEGADGLTPPAETALHLAVYEAQADAKSVIHVHPSWIVALSAVGRELLPIFGSYDSQAAYLALQGIPTYQSSVSIHEMATGREVAKVMGTSPVCVLKGHGIVVSGKSVEDSLHLSMATHELGRMNWLAAAVGTPQPISSSDYELFDQRQKRRSNKQVRREDGVSAFWHYMERRISGYGGDVV